MTDDDNPTGVPGAKIIATESFLRAQQGIKDLVAKMAMGVFFGDAGTGKTFAVNVACKQVKIETVRLDVPTSATVRFITLELLQMLTGVTHDAERFRLTSDLRACLSERPRLVVLDESQRLGHDVIESLRSMHDDPRTRFALAFAGGVGCKETLERYPMLRSRCKRWIPFAPLTERDVVEAIPGYHQIYAKAEKEVLLEIDRRFGHGNFRDWAYFTDDAIDICREWKRKTVDEGVMLEVFARRGGGEAEAA